MKRTLLLATAGLAVVLGALLATGHLPLRKMLHPAPPGSAQAEPPSVRSAPPAVSVIRVSPARLVETVLVSGTLVPREEIMVAPEVEGLRVLALNVDEGDPVRQGQVMATLAHDVLDAQLAQNAATLERADAAIAQARSSITQAAARAEEARLALDRAVPLRTAGHIADSMFDQRRAAARTAEAALTAARDGLKVAEAEKAQVEAHRRELAWRRANTEVKAPADGLISRRSARVGALSSGAADPMFRIIARGEIELDAEVPEEKLASVRAGQAASVSVAGLGEARGLVRLVSPEIDRSTRLGRVRISLGRLEQLRIGGFARGYITTAEASGLTVPESAVLYGEQGPTVQLVEGGRVITRRIRTGLRSGGLIEVREGVAAGDAVVARSGTFLRAGDEVRPVFEPGGKVSEAR